MATSTDVLESLRRDLALEHGAILQYVIHAVQLRDTAIADIVKRVAREEMWHLEWLAEAIRDRGGEPTLARADVFVSGTIGEELRTDVATEQGALDHYTATLGLIGDTDPDLTALIERIMDDERHHKHLFAGLAGRVELAGEEAYSAVPVIQPADLGVVGPTMAAEYQGILAYLWNKFGCGDCDLSEEFFEMAIDEMRHAGWAASYVAGVTVPQAPPVPVDKVTWVHSGVEAKEQARRLESFSEDFYAAKASEAANPDLRSDLERAAVQHGYHRRQLEEME
jgi:bacterioferritin